MSQQLIKDRVVVCRSADAGVIGDERWSLSEGTYTLHLPAQRHTPPSIFLAPRTASTLFRQAITEILQERLHIDFEDARDTARGMWKVATEEEQKRYSPIAEDDEKRWKAHVQRVEGGGVVRQKVDEQSCDNIVRAAQSVRLPRVVRTTLKPVIENGHPWLCEDDGGAERFEGGALASGSAMAARGERAVTRDTGAGTTDGDVLFRD
ncbi:hypothetical protein PMIN06_008902 [Paraphaeosphaeria minitans]